MTQSQELVISKDDHERLSALVANLHSKTGLLIEEELGRAIVVEPEQLPKNVVSMGSVVCFIDELTGQEQTVELLYPHEMDKPSDYQKVSVLAPVGAALIGLGIGQSIEWPMPNNKTKYLKVVSVKNRYES